MNNNTFVHKYIKSLINKDDVCIDMTAGNGFDTIFLSEHCKKVYSFDISKKAIDNTSKKIKKDNVVLINDNHINVDRYVNEKIKLAIFNLGYLPHDDSLIITKADETLLAFKKTYELICTNGYIVITFYLGHLGGKDEYYLLDKYFNDINIKVIEKYRQDKINSPITYIIKKSSI